MLSARFRQALYGLILNALMDVLERIITSPEIRKSLSEAFDQSDSDGDAPQKVAALRASLLDENSDTGSPASRSA